MYIGSVQEIPKVDMNIPGAANAVKQTLLGPEQGWDGWVMRMFTLKERGNTPRHTHPWPHINYIVSGSGMLHIDGRDNTVGQGSTAFVPAGAEHQFVNTGDEDFVFICIVPEEGDA